MPGSLHFILLSLHFPILNADMSLFLLPFGGCAEGLAQHFCVLHL